MTEYVNGFAFERDNVALIVKQRPAWQAGKLNGIGGHIEPGETPIDAMVREFWEETGRATVPSDWQKFAELTDGVRYKVYFFVSYQDSLSALKSTTDEQVVVVPVDSVHVANAIPNLSWLLPMAQNISFDRADWLRIVEFYEV